MITRYDELFCHQAVSTLDRPATSAREWTERAWMMAHTIDGSAHLATGFGYYPNRNIMDAFACLTIRDETLYVVRASRELRPDVDVFDVGPFHYEVVEPLRAVRFALAENPYGLTFDVETTGVSPLHEEPEQFQVSRGRVREHIKRMVQSGRPRGRIAAGGETFEAEPSGWVSERDRSWGVRISGAEILESGVQPHEQYPGGLFTFVLMQFPSWGATFHIREVWDEQRGFVDRWHFGGGMFYPYGSGREAVALRDVEHQYTFSDARPDQPRRFAGGRVVLSAVDGTKKEVTIRPISICYQGVGGYGLPFRGFVHGLWMGSEWMDGYELDVTKADVMREVWGYCDYGSEFRCDGEVGYGTTELSVSGKYPKYGFEGR
jgi:hypothetical protein